MNETRRDFWLSCSVSLILAVLIMGILASCGVGVYYISSNMFVFLQNDYQKNTPFSLLTASTRTPKSVDVGENLTIALDLDNLSEDNIFVTKIQLPSCMDDLAEFNHVYPMPSEVIHYDDKIEFVYIGYDEMILWSERVMENSSTTLEFEFSVKNAGECSGEIQIYAGNLIAVTSFSITTETPIGGAFVPTGEIIFEEDFSSVTNTWYPYHEGNIAGYRMQHKYMVEASQYSQNNADLYDSAFYRNMIIHAEVEERKRTDGYGYYGLMCRYENNNYYAFMFSDDGYFAILKSINGEEVFLHDWEYAPLIFEDKPNSMDAICIGSEIELAINGILVAKVTDPNPLPFTVGIALFVGTSNEAKIMIAFDNIVIYAPQENLPTSPKTSIFSTPVLATSSIQIS